MPKPLVLVLGCGGIIGQHMMLSVPPGIEAVFVRKHPFPLAEDVDLLDKASLNELLDSTRPDVVVNLAGESNTDAVERDPDAYAWMNMLLPRLLTSWCLDHRAHLIHVSSQAVMDGQHAPYTEANATQGVPVNAYGQQKRDAEAWLTGSSHFTRWTIVRPTFVLGVRPFPALGRMNPAEQILSGHWPKQVNNRWFSLSFAWDVAEKLWHLALEKPQQAIVHCGNPERLSRYELAKMLAPKLEFEPVTHEAYAAASTELIADRPVDTTYADGCFGTSLSTGLYILALEHNYRAQDALPYRAAELSCFLGTGMSQTLSKLNSGFGELHKEVTEDFQNVFGRRTPSQTALLQWYRSTDAYLWELTAYHCDPGFNYDGMCRGIIERLRADGAKRVLCLGDGVGTFTIRATEAGRDAEYHDLYGSRTAAFAQARFAMRFKQDIACMWSHEFEVTPEAFTSVSLDLYDAVVSLDFLEHVPNVEAWVVAIFHTLKPGGLFCAQNAFGAGSGPQGAMPMHLACNDRYVEEWDPLLKRVGFVQESPQWYRKPL